MSENNSTMHLADLKLFTRIFRISMYQTDTLPRTRFSWSQAIEFVCFRKSGRNT